MKQYSDDISLFPNLLGSEVYMDFWMNLSYALFN